MNRKKAYVSPQVMRVKLEPTQAVLSHCAVGVTGVSDGAVGGVCNVNAACKLKSHGGDNADAS
jgi:hypothetical protein